ncbi:MAG: esterase-like activity of phytase family protein [Parasphingopyxis sp.]
MILGFAGSILILGRSEPERAPAHGPITAQAVPLDPDDPERDRVGGLVYLGGWVLRSSDPDFGGISAMALDDGLFTAVGDAGGVFRFGLDEAGRIRGAEIAALPDGPAPEGGGAIRKRDRDAESLAHDPASGAFWIGFERANVVWRYDRRIARAEAHHAPEAMEDWPSNGGAEALVRLPDGRFLIMSEEGAGPGGSREALLFDGDPAAGERAVTRFGFGPPADHNVTDAAILPDGRLLVLTRRFSFVEGVSIVLCAVEFAAIEEGAVLGCEALARLAPPLTIDNMEALAVGEEDGRTILWMASDDNFNPLQRTLLLKFALAEE